MLTAEPGELHGAFDTPLSRHLASCPRCREAAARIMASTAVLDEWLGAPAAVPDVDRVLWEAATPVPPRRRGLAWAVPVALAAGVAALLLLGRERTPTAAVEAPVAARVGASEASTLDLEVPEGSDAAVFATADPDITVIWFLGGDR